MVELVAVLAMSATLLGLALPPLENSRELARRETCLCNLTTIGKACLEYDSVNSTLPPYMGIPEHILNDPFASYTMQLSNYQNTYSQIQLLPFVGHADLADEIDTFAFSSKLATIRSAGYPSLGSWLNGIDEDFPGVLPVITDQNLPVFRCPNDSVIFGEEMVFGVHPSGDATIFWSPLSGGDELVLSLTNFAFNGGAIAVTSTPDANLQNAGWIGFHGPVRSRSADSVVSIADGASNVALFGEAIGEVEIDFLGLQEARHSLLGGLAFGRADLYFTAQMRVFGDTEFSRAFQFGSLHPDTVNFVRCDGSVTSVDRDVDSTMMGRFCGVADGNAFELVVLGDLDGNGDVNLLDVDPFTDSVINGDFSFSADINQDDSVDLLDVDRLLTF